MSDEFVATSETRAPASGRKTLERRGVFAAAWAAIAGLLIAKNTEPVAAAAGFQFQDTGGGGFVNNSAGGPSAAFSNSLYSSTSATLVGYAFQGAATAGVAGVNGSGSAIAPLACGIYGSQVKTSSGVTAGVYGENTSAAGYGVLGRSISGAALGDGTGVLGESAGGFAVRGEIRNSNKQAIAVYGENFSTYTGGNPGAGGFGVYGYSSYGHGLLGASGTAGGAGVIGATNGVAGAYAAVFYGPVVVTGSLAVLGAKNAAVEHPDGTHRLVYSVESPESWFEDFGTGTLVEGRADIHIDPNFAAIADLESYHVFVTVYEQHNDLMVSDRTPKGFRVKARDCDSAGEFSWRVVAKRKDIVGERLAVVTIPPQPELPKRHEAESNDCRPVPPLPGGHRSPQQIQ